MRKLAIVMILCLAPVWARESLISLNYVNADLGWVLKKRVGPALGMNVYLSPEVTGSVTVSVRDVPAQKALDLILHMQDTHLAYKVVGNTLVVATPERLGKIDEKVLSPGWQQLPGHLPQGRTRL